MNILVTGCAGFIGSSLTQRLLNEDYRVIGIDNFDPFYPKALKEKNLKALLYHPCFTFYEADITEPDCFSVIKDNINCVVHLAAKAGVRPSIDFPSDYTKNNIFGTQNLLNWMVLKGIHKYIFASSSSVYGNSLTVPFKETQDVNETISPYAFTKKSGEILNYTYHHLYNIDIVNLRLFTVYGPKQRPDLAIRKFTDLIYSDKPVTLYGDGTSSRDYTFIDDIVEGIISSVRLVSKSNDFFEIINLGSNHPITLIEMVNVISDAVGKKPEIIFNKMQPGDVSRTYADITKAGRLLSYSPRTPFKEGITKFVEWYFAQN
ncbi:MAG: GDP-mannose 4,6-dehydratase [Bacteroidales bacterium]|nr:GDP-mannose 4,6-dehydratase [Bacteroidales bacterium]